MENSVSRTLSLVDDPRQRTAERPLPHLFLALECGRPLASGARYALSGFAQLTIGRGHDRSLSEQLTDGRRIGRLQVPDSWMSGGHAQLALVGGSFVLEDLKSKNGTVVNGVRQDRVVLADGDLLELGKTFFIFREAIATGAADAALLEGADTVAPSPGMATLLPPLQRQLDALGQVARSPVSVVVLGESGTGKELIARAVHALSARAGAFAAVNCGALPDSILLSELFGYKKGAFSGASEDRPGLVRSADRGTLFLDEIGDLPAASQAAFLRVLQEREVTPVGGTRPVPVDVRLVAATHRDLETLQAKGQFRGDLWARISGFVMRLPPLRQRREDFGLLIATLLPRVAGERAERVTFSGEAARALFRHEWPLNIRELEKALTAAVVLAGDGRIEEEHLPESVRNPSRSGAEREDDEPVSDEDANRPLSEEQTQRREELIALLREHHGNISAVARAMGKARMQIQRWVKRYGIDPRVFHP